VSLSLYTSEFRIERDLERCIACQVCVRQCANDCHVYDEDDDCVVSNERNCVGCHRCATLCPTNAITITQNPNDFKANANWTARAIKDIYKQAESGGVLLTGMGCDRQLPSYFDRMLLNASQVTNPSIDPLREPMELRTHLGCKPERVTFNRTEEGYDLTTKLSPQLVIETPIMFSAMSYGSISYNACLALATAAQAVGTFYNTGFTRMARIRSHRLPPVVLVSMLSIWMLPRRSKSRLARVPSRESAAICLGRR
jgi:glutamate synthase domain-containing protein 2